MNVNVKTQGTLKTGKCKNTKGKTNNTIWRRVSNHTVRTFSETLKTLPHTATRSNKHL